MSKKWYYKSFLPHFLVHSKSSIEKTEHLKDFWIADNLCTMLIYKLFFTWPSYFPSLSFHDCYSELFIISKHGFPFPCLGSFSAHIWNACSPPHSASFSLSLLKPVPCVETHLQHLIVYHMKYLMTTHKGSICTFLWAPLAMYLYVALMTLLFFLTLSFT